MTLEVTQSFVGVRGLVSYCPQTRRSSPIGKTEGWEPSPAHRVRSLLSPFIQRQRKLKCQAKELLATCLRILSWIHGNFLRRVSFGSWKASHFLLPQGLSILSPVHVAGAPFFQLLLCCYLLRKVSCDGPQSMLSISLHSALHCLHFFLTKFIIPWDFYSVLIHFLTYFLSLLGDYKVSKGKIFLVCCYIPGNYKNSA